MRRVWVALVATALLSSCTKQIEVQSDASWTGIVNQASVAGKGNMVYELEGGSGFTFLKDTEEGYLGVRFKKGRGDEPETTAPYGMIWGSAW